MITVVLTHALLNGPAQTDATLLANNTLLDATFYVRLHTLLHVFACYWAKFETDQTLEPATPNISFVPWSPKRGATMLDPFALLLQH